MNIKIGMDAKRIVRNASGLGSYGRNLVNALTDSSDCPEIVLYAPDEGRADLRSQVHASERLRFAYSGKRWRLAQDLWRGKGIVADLQRDGIDLYHGLTGELPLGIRRSGIKTVVTIHDLIFLRHPEYYHRLDVMLYRRKFYRTLREADRIIAISECTKRDILYYSDYPADRIDVIYQNCSSDFRRTAGDGERAAVRRRYALPDHYILNVGTIEERKNVMLAVKALPQLPRREHLVIVGRKTAYTNEVMEYAAHHGVETASFGSTVCPTLICQLSIRWPTCLCILRATRVLACPSSRLLRVDCLWWLPRDRVWKRPADLTTAM